MTSHPTAVGAPPCRGSAGTLRPVRRVLGLVVCGLLVAGCGGGAARGEGPPRRTDVAGADALFGAWVARAGSGSPAALRADLAATERGLGARLGIRHFYTPWSAQPDLRPVRDAVRAGSVPMVSWNDGSDNAAVAAGAHDERIRRLARGLDRLGTRVLLRWGWEMDADGGSGSGSFGPAEEWVAAYRHLHDVVRAEGAERVELVWCPTAWGFRPGSGRDPAEWYPGDDVVDWVCADGYNWSRDGEAWQSFDAVFRHFLRWARTTGKPIMIGEVGTQEDPGDADRKAAWISAMGRSLKCRDRDVEAVVWFDSDRSTVRGHTWDWRLDSSPRALAAAGDVVADRHFGGDEDTIDCPQRGRRGRR